MYRDDNISVLHLTTYATNTADDEIKSFSQDNAIVISNYSFSNSYQGRVSWTLVLELSPGECHNTLMMISQHGFM